MRSFILPVLCCFALDCAAQAGLQPLTVEKIMRDPRWIGTSPSQPEWSADGGTLFFKWNPEKNVSDSFYRLDRSISLPVKVTLQEQQEFVSAGNVVYSKDRKSYTWSKNGNIFFYDGRKRIRRQVTTSTEAETDPAFSFNETCVVYNRASNLYSWNIATGETVQLTNFRNNEDDGKPKNPGNPQEDWLKRDQLSQLEVLRTRKEKRDLADSAAKRARPKEMRVLSLEGRSVQQLNISADGHFISYVLNRSATGNRNTIVPNYVTETGFTTDIPGRTKVGSIDGTSALFIYDLRRDTVYTIRFDSIPGIQEIPSFFNDYPTQIAELNKKKVSRVVAAFPPTWSDDGSHALIDIRSRDNKDRWLMNWDTSAHDLKLIDRQHDEAWIDGPGVYSTGWIDEQTCWFQSEQTGYSHLYTYNLVTGVRRALTSGTFEVQQAGLSNDHRSFFISTNEVHPGEQQFYKLDIATGKKQRLTWLTGANQVTLSPDESRIAVLYSASTRPWELYVQPVNRTSAEVRFATNQARSAEFNSYTWKEPEIVQIPASDGKMIYARLYKPANARPGMPAVFFVHGAGYLQNAHKWWSSYFREYMFNNLLADNGYYVLDIDYRGSAGYGRDWRTGIYRFMGGRDLDDHIDASRWLVKQFGVDSTRIGLYGGSYGGFMTLMAMFTRPGSFAAGAALRPVTDWANYNDRYTANILNDPSTDSIAYRRSSPWYHAAGLQGNLLICHGMVDVNVHYQDAVKLTQRLIELGKDNWELASYPMEDHGFVEPSSWTDEYKRILKLFNRVLKRP